MNMLGGMEHGGHHVYEDACEKLSNEGIEPSTVQFGMSVRDPVDRLISTINHQFAGRLNYNLDRVFEDVAEEPQRFFPPQRHFLGRVNIEDIRLFPFEGLGIVRWLGFKGTIHNHYPGKRMYLPEDIVSHPGFVKAIRLYEDDWELRRRALGGHWHLEAEAA